jgi:hypothetical protein
VKPRHFFDALGAAIGFVAAAIVLCIVGILLWPVFSEAKEIKLKWKKIDGAKTYNLEVARDSNFSEKVLSEKVKDTSLQYELKSGAYYLRVQGIDKLGREGAWSKPFKLVVTAPVDPIEEKADAAPKKVTYIAHAPEVKSEWKTREASSDFRVVVKKDGKEVFTKETNSPKVDFKPDEPGNYEVEVASGVHHVFGAPVRVDHFEVEKKDLVPPKWEMPAYKRYTNKKAIEFKWEPVEGVDSYHIVVYKTIAEASLGSGTTVDGRLPSSLVPEKREIAYEVTIPAQKFKDDKFVMPPLPPGRYVAAVEAVAGESEKAPSTSYQFDIKRAKPVEFEKFDINLSYVLTPISYQVNIREANAFSQASSFGGKGVIEGTLWAPDSNWGVRAEGSWGGFMINNTNITYNDMMATGIYRWDLDTSGLLTQIKPYAGARAWTIPVVVPGNSQTGSSGSGSNMTEIYSPTLMGAVLGVEVVRPLSQKFALDGGIQLSVPFFASNAGTNPIQIKQDPSPKVYVGSKIALPGSIRLLAMAGYQEDDASWTPGNGAKANTNCNNCSSDSNAHVGAVQFTIGVEASDDGPLFATRTEAQGRPDRFSDFNFTARYNAAPMQYKSTLAEYNLIGGAIDDVGMDYAGSIDMDMTGWFRDSKNGIRAQASWGGFTLQNSNVSYPEFLLQWGYRPDLKGVSDRWSFKNYLGLRVWQMPIIGLNGKGGSGGQSPIDVHLPQLLGPAETLALTKRIGQGWTANWLTTLSTPALLTNKDQAINKLFYGDISIKTEADAVRSFGSDLNAGVGLGYDFENFEYEPTVVIGQTSRVLTTAPYLTLFGTYSF